MAKHENDGCLPARPLKRTRTQRIEFIAAMPAIDGLPIEFIADSKLGRAASRKGQDGVANASNSAQRV